MIDLPNRGGEGSHHSGPTAVTIPDESFPSFLNLSPDLLRRLLRAKDRIDAASHEEWPVRRLARISHVSQAHFARSFKDAFGVPPHRYLLSRRIERAVSLLCETNMAVSEIAFSTGWQSLGTFGRVFRDITGQSPSLIRQQHRANAEELKEIPICILLAANRPNLKIAVSEKRLREVRDSSPPHTKEVP